MADDGGTWWRRKPVELDKARVALEGAQAEIAELRIGLLIENELLLLLARTAPARPCDPFAERRVLGWLLSGGAGLEDLGELSPYDFTSLARRSLMMLARGLVALNDPRWAPERPLVFELLDGIDCPKLADAMEAELWSLPYPQAVPSRELDLVVALGRRWSVVDDAYRGAE